MNKLAIFGVAAFLSCTLTATGSEVAEAAKKEKVRRAAVEKQRKPAQVFTNQDVAGLKSSLAFEVSQPETIETAQPPQITTVPGPPDIAPPPPVQKAGASADDREREEETKRLKEEREALEQQAKDAQQTINQGGGYHTRNIGTQYKAKREAETRIRQIDQELEKNEKEEEEKE